MIDILISTPLYPLVIHLFNVELRLCYVISNVELRLIVGPKNKGAILTIIDRISRHCILEKLTGKTSLEVSNKIIKLLNSSSNSVFTVTTDNSTLSYSNKQH